MSDALTIALTIKATDLASDVVRRFDARVSQSNKRVRDEWALTKQHVEGAAKGIGLAMLALNRSKVGIDAAASMQEAMIGVKMNLAGSIRESDKLNASLDEVKRTAIAVSSNMQFSAEDVVGIQGDLLKAGVALKDVAGESGAAFAVAALADLENQLPGVIANGVVGLDAAFGGLGDEFKNTADWLVRISDATSASAQSLLSQSTMAAANAKRLGITPKDMITALGVLSPLGDMSGTALNAMFSDLADPKKAGFAWENGKFIGLNESMTKLKKLMADLPNDQARSVALQQVFNERSLRAAGLWLDSKKTFEGLNKEAAATIGLVDRLDIKAEGLKTTVGKLKGTWKTSLGEMFMPLVNGVLNPMANAANNTAGWVGKKTTDNPWIANTVSGVAGGAVAMGGLYALLKTFQAAGSFRRVLGGMSGTAAGIAQGKAIEAATGVTPVFVTNWPSSKTADTAASVAAGRLLPGGGRMGGAIGGVGMTAAKWAGGIGIAGAAGYGFGSLLNTGYEKLSGNSFGSDLFDFFNSDKAKVGGEMVIRIDQDGRASVSDVKQRDNTSISVETGRYHPAAG